VLLTIIKLVHLVGELTVRLFNMHGKTTINNIKIFMPVFIYSRRGCSTASCFGKFNIKTQELGINCIGNWNGFLAGLESSAKRKNYLGEERVNCTNSSFEPLP
jgi:hypothetical protein